MTAIHEDAGVVTQERNEVVMESHNVASVGESGTKCHRLYGVPWHRSRVVPLNAFAAGLGLCAQNTFYIYFYTHPHSIASRPCGRSKREPSATAQKGPASV
jgi:hypothetical protein